MRIISSTGYGATGSTAVTDLISEYNSVVSCDGDTGYEFKFFHNPNGILGLENFLVNCSITSTKHFAAINFLNLCEKWAKNGIRRNYEIIFKNKFIELTNQYLANLGGEDYFIEKDVSKITNTQAFILKVVNKINRFGYYIFHRKVYGHNKCRYVDLFSNDRKNYLYDLDQLKFDKYTKEYFNNLFTLFSNDGIANVHELIPIHMIEHCSKWFDDIRVIASNRDPRDLYITKKYLAWTPSYPINDVRLFCKYYKWLIKNVEKVQNAKVYWLQFENLVYNYDSEVKKIEEFCSLSKNDHICIKTRFIPEKASKNCNVFKNYVNEMDNIAYIEKELKEYLYDFEN